MPAASPGPTRRDFLAGAAAAGGALVIGLRIGAARAGDGAAPAVATPGAGDAPAQFMPNAYIRIDASGAVTLVVGMAEMGQGVLTSLPQILAEELEADWRRVRFEQAPVDPAYNNPMFKMQGTGGSTSVRAHWLPLRKAGAAAREMLVAAAAQQWGADASKCHAREGAVLHADGRRLGYGELVAAAARLPVPSDPPLKSAKDYRIVGQPLPRLDTPLKVNGSARFGLDVRLPGLLVAVIARAPTVGGKAASWDATAARALPGVRHVVAVGNGVAVVADTFWAARQGREALKVQWDDGPHADLASAKVREAMLARLDAAGVVARNDGDVGAARGQSVVESTYEAPFLAHACMEPMNATASVTADGVEVWAPTQAPGVNRAVIAGLLGMAPERVQVHTMMLGGGFGRRFAPDFIADAVQLSKAVAAPVKLVYTREDDMRAQYYRPAALVRLAAGLDAAGRPVRYEARVVCPSVQSAGRFPLKDGLDESSVEGLDNWPYAVPNARVEWLPYESGVGVWFWRSVGNSQNGFFAEGFTDELAHAAGQDPYQYRRGLLAHKPRHLAVLDLAAKMSGWGAPAPAGRARGIAVCESFGSYVAEVAEVSLGANGVPRVHRVTCAIDCGTVVNPGIVTRQVQSAVMYGLSAALHGEITLDAGRVQQGNFDTYPVVRMDEAPVVEVHIVPSAEAPGGVGEPGTPPIAPAVANALFALNGQRLRRLPLRAGT